MVDLHVHTTVSDGVFTPDELIQQAIKKGLKVLCITDHNAVNENLRELRKNILRLSFRQDANFHVITRHQKGE